MTRRTSPDNTAGDYFLGLDIGGTKCTLVLGQNDDRAADNSPVPIDRIRFQTPVGMPSGKLQDGIQAILAEIMEQADRLLSRNQVGKEDLRGCGISCGGPLDTQRGLILSPPNLPGWDQVPIVKELAAHTGVSTCLENDANACALAEWRYGAGRGYRNVLFLTFGTGIGAGLILDGRLYRGTSDMAGEIGHVRMERNGPVGYGKEGSFEGFCSGGGIARMAISLALEKLQQGKTTTFCRSLDDLAHINAKMVADAAEQGDETALRVYRRSGEYLGRGLSILIDILNPEIIIIGSIFLRSEALMREAMQQAIDEETLEQARRVCRVVPAGLGEAIGEYAALAVSCQPVQGGTTG